MEEQSFNEAGAYAVRFWRDGAWRTVVVDDWIPCDRLGVPLFAQVARCEGGEGEFWPLSKFIPNTSPSLPL